MPGRLAPVLTLAVLLGAAGISLLLVDEGGSDASTATLSGTAYRLVSQTVVDGVVVDETQVPVTDGRIAIPELGIDMPLALDGSFRFSALPVRADPASPTEVTVVFTAPGLGSFTFLHLRLYPGSQGPILTPQMIDTPRVGDLSRGHKGTMP